MNKLADDTETVELPREQFLSHVLGLAAEGDVLWEVDEEVREQLGYSDVKNPGNVTSVETTDDHVRIFAELSASVSERTSRSTRWQPAEYKNHDVTILVATTLYWNDDTLAETEMLVEQAQYPTKPPAPDV